MTDKIQAEQDSREILEAKVREVVTALMGDADKHPSVYEQNVDLVLHLLDRQEAITKAKCEEPLASKNLGRLYKPRDNDTREALENDAVLYCNHFTCTHQRFNEAKLIALLDRQAAITRAECMGRYADSLYDPLKERIAELLRCLENDWHIHASWDGLRKLWCIELIEEDVVDGRRFPGVQTLQERKEEGDGRGLWGYGT